MVKTTLVTGQAIAKLDSSGVWTIFHNGSRVDWTIEERIARNLLSAWSNADPIYNPVDKRSDKLGRLEVWESNHRWNHPELWDDEISEE